MRRSFMLVPILAVLLMSPTGALAVDDPLIVCDPAPEGFTEVGPGASLTPEVASPQNFDDVTDLNYQMDLYPATAAAKATVSSALSWQIVANDFDLVLLDGDGTELAISEGVQPLDPSEEFVGGTIKHCGLFTIRILNYTAVGGAGVDMIDPLQLTVATGNKK